MGEHDFLLRQLHDPLLDTGSRYKAIYHHLTLLPNAVRTRERLDVIVRIPIAIIQDDGIGRRQVNAQSTGTRAEQKDKLFRARPVEGVDPLLPLTADDTAKRCRERAGELHNGRIRSWPPRPHLPSIRSYAQPFASR